MVRPGHFSLFALTIYWFTWVEATDMQDPLQYFKLFITVEMLDVVVTETNSHAQQLINSSVSKRWSRLNNWVDMTRDELFSLFLYQGIV